MKGRILLLGLLALGRALPAGAEPASAPALQAVEIASPAGPGASAPVLSADTAGGLWLIWTEPRPNEVHSLRCARLDPSGTWDSPRTITQSNRLAVLGGQPAAFTAGDGVHLTAAWLTSDGGIMASRSDDAGQSWSTPAPLGENGAEAESPGLATLANGRVLAAWIESHGDGDATLQVRFLGTPEPDDPPYPRSVFAVPVAPVQIQPLLDGGALIAFLAPPAGDLGGRRLIRLHDGRWQTGSAIIADRFSPPLARPAAARIAVDGGRVGAVWLGACGRTTGLIASFSPDAGTRFLAPETLAVGPALGSPDVAIQHDGALLAIWPETAPADGETHVRLARLSPDFFLAPRDALDLGVAHAQDRPSLALAADYAGRATTAEAIVAFSGTGDHAGLRLFRVIIPEGALLAAANEDCHCAPTPQELMGYTIRGRVAAVDRSTGIVRLDADAVPGVMDAGLHGFTCAPADLAGLRLGTACLGRIMRTPSGWRLFATRILEEAP